MTDFSMNDFNLSDSFEELNTGSEMHEPNGVVLATIAILVVFLRGCQN